MEIDPRMAGIIDDLGKGPSRAANFQRVRSVPFRPENDILLVSAARGRDIAISAYIRRAAMAFTAFDLGMTYDEISRNEYPVNFFGGRKIVAAELAPRAFGRGAGRWHITGLTNK